MTEKELKKLNRYQLLELIILQTEQIQELQSEVQNMQEKLQERQIQIAQSGSIAEASLQLSGVFAAAQQAADIYLENLRNMAADADSIRENARQEAAAITAGASQEVDRITAAAKEEALQLTAEAQAVLTQAQAQAEELRSDAAAVLEQAREDAARLMGETTEKCQEKERAVNSYIASVRESLHSQFQNLNQLFQNQD